MINFRKTIYPETDETANPKIIGTRAEIIENWLPQVQTASKNGHHKVMFIEMACFMYINRPDLLKIFQTMIQFKNCQMIYNTIDQAAYVQDHNGNMGKTKCDNIKKWLIADNEDPFESFRHLIKSQETLHLLEEDRKIKQRRMSPEDYQSWFKTASAAYPKIETYKLQHLVLQ